MGAISDYIFNNSHYKEVLQAYELVHTPAMQNAFNIWQKHHGLSLGEAYKDKEYIFEHIAEIKSVDSWVRTTHKLRSNMYKGMEWLYSEKRGLSSIPAMVYKEYEFIATNESKIKTYDKYYKIYEKLSSSCREAILWLYFDSFGINEFPQCNYKEIEFIATNEVKINNFQRQLNEFNRISKKYLKACERLVNKESVNFTFIDKKKIANSEFNIKQIDEELKRIKALKTAYPLAWQQFSNGKNWETLTLVKLKTAEEQKFKVKEAFLKYWDKCPELVKLVLGEEKHLISSFANDIIEKEQLVLDYLSIQWINEYKPYCRNVHLDTSDELKRAIMDSEDYGKKCSFSDSFNITSFYSFRDDFDKIGVNFDEAIEKEKENDIAVRAYNKEKYGKDVSYIEDYLRIVTESEPLYVYVEEYKNEKEKRDKAKYIQRYYDLGFKAIYGDKNLDNCAFNDIINIIENESWIKTKNTELEAIEQKRREEDEKRRIINSLKSCVSSWSHPSRSTLECFSLYYYYPTTCDWNASEEEWDVRNLIWDFKANPNRPQSESEIKRRHENALNKVIPRLDKVINYYFGEKKSKLTLVCIPSSKRIVTERRYKDLAQKLCGITGMANGFSYVSVTTEGDAKHLGGTSDAEFCIDASYFKDRYILLFDDVITSGASMERFKRTLESIGAIVIGGISIGKTKHERQLNHPINLLG